MPGSKRGSTGLIVLVSLSAVTTALAGFMFAELLGSDSWGAIDALLFLLFTILYFWISLGFWTATFGFAWSLFEREKPIAQRGAHRLDVPLPATAILMPIHDEDPRRVFANLRAVRASLNATGNSEAFHIFVLSDTRHPEIWAAEECEWAKMRTTAEGHGLFYRRRIENVDRKSGNIQDFCEHWGPQYRYMVVLDADSLMAGETLVEMVRRMEDDPQLGILQVPPVLVNRDSFFGRLLQFSSALYGNVFRSGFSLWARSEGNYWGHNSILRIEPFMQCCGLPHLPGPPPWGGAILSHDFVEAALMVSAGWKVVVANDLAGSYEECPSNLIDFAKRDERWSRGNLQHIPLTVAAGIHPVSRFHLGMGVLSYLASPLWALFMLLSLVQGIGWQITARPTELDTDMASVPAIVAVAPLGGALTLLLLVKVWALVGTFLRRSLSSGFGRPLQLTLSVLLETVLSFLLAPILMAFHTTFVINSLLRRKVEWEAQPRGENAISWSEAFGVHASHTIAGLIVALLVTWGAQELFWWMLPILLGLIFSVPISVVLSNVRIGRRLRAAGILLIPEEISPPPILKTQHACLVEEMASPISAIHPFVRLVADPVFLRLHLALLPESDQPSMSPAVRDRLKRIALSGGARHTKRSERLQLLQDREALVWLHRELWKDWPVDLLQKVAALAR